MDPSALFAPISPSLPAATLVSLGFNAQQALVFRAGIALCEVGIAFNAAVGVSLSQLSLATVPPPTTTIDALAIGGWFNDAFADIAYVNTLLSEAGYNVP